MSSITLPPYNAGGFQRFVDTQFRAKVVRPPPGTSFRDQTVIVTGANVGIGLEAARVLLSLQASHLILAVRSLDKGEAAAGPLRKAYPKAKIEVWRLDMLSYDSIRDFSAKCSNLERLDVAILNAACSRIEFAINKSTGHEETFQTNYLSTALLAILLVPIMRSKKRTTPGSPPPRLAIVSSGLALSAGFPNHEADPLIPSFDSKAIWSSSGGQFERYSVTKTLELMLVLSLSRLVDPKDVLITAVDPGFTRGSQLHRDMSVMTRIILWFLKALTARSLTEAAWTYIDAINSSSRGGEIHGSFIMNFKITPFPPLMYTPKGEQVTSRLWKETMQDFETAGFKGLEQSLRG
ncbi:hypothetical protein B0A52_06305 [Exophiala mesophila]|uniref:Ketoreductase (KR) domain-containing protein n=1 Tax=Exophiala mesophila TaxID=212818 RepID=A0A438N370_EXOME|nr:hypothetical protein B0A52_06305 [Exophiala mesophila]